MEESRNNWYAHIYITIYSDSQRDYYLNGGTAY